MGVSDRLERVSPRQLLAILEAALPAVPEPILRDWIVSNRDQIVFELADRFDAIDDDPALQGRLADALDALDRFCQPHSDHAGLWDDQQTDVYAHGELTAVVAEARADAAWLAGTHPDAGRPPGRSNGAARRGWWVRLLAALQRVLRQT